MRFVNVKFYLFAHYDVLPRLPFKLLLVSFMTIWSASAAEIACENIDHRFKCEMQKTTSIDSSDVIISGARDENMVAISFYNNKKIFYLPIKMHEKFPNLTHLFAHDCSISAIFKKNFDKLNQLTYLALLGNKVERIESGTFDDLLSIETIDLSEFLIC